MPHFFLVLESCVAMNRNMYLLKSESELNNTLIIDPRWTDLASKLATKIATKPINPASEHLIGPMKTYC